MVRSKEDMLGGEEGEEKEEGVEMECILGRLEDHNLEWVVQKVLIMLDLVSLHVARQVRGEMETNSNFSPRCVKGGMTT